MDTQLSRPRRDAYMVFGHLDVITKHCGSESLVWLGIMRVCSCAMYVFEHVGVAQSCE